MSEPKPFASLSPALLARKGSARPAMRPQYQAGPSTGLAPFSNAPRLVVPGAEDPLEDLGWNDLGQEAEPAAAPEVLRERAALAEAVETAAPVAEAAPVVTTKARRGPAVLTLPAGRRAAFTLRVDPERHLRLRLACTLQNRSAQHLITEAMDRLLADLPGLDDLAQHARNA